MRFTLSDRTWGIRPPAAVLAAACCLAAGPSAAAAPGEVTTMIEKLHWLGHASFRIDGSAVVYFDPWKVAAGPPADLILVTHEHHDHCSREDVDRLAGPATAVVAPSGCAAKLGRKVTSLAPGGSLEVKGVLVEAVAAYNVGKKFHPRENNWVGYVATVDGVRYYHTGDSDLTPEMQAVKADVLLVPVGGTYTMTAAEAARAARAIGPKVAVPMHWGDIVGGPADAEAFRKEAGVPVQVLEPGR